MNLSCNVTEKAGIEVAKQHFATMPYAVYWVSYAENQKFQYECGDCIIKKVEDGWTSQWYTEVKAEQTFTGNLFIENWSNKREGRRGWLHNLIECNVFFYIFLNKRVMYTIDFKKLRGFNLKGYPEVPQTKTEQANDTWGLLVPITDLKKAGVIRQERYY